MVKMKEKPSIAIAGATGLVGNEIVALIGDLKIPFSEIRLFASEDSVGERYQVGADEAIVELLTPDSLRGFDLVVLALPQELSERHAQIAREAGAVVIDTSTNFRLDPQVPLVVAGVN